MNCLTSNSWPTNFFAARSSISNLYNDCSFEPDFLNCCEGLQVIAEQSRRVDAKLLVNGGFGHHAGSFFDGVDVGGCLGGAVAQRRRDRLARLDKVAVDDLADVRSHVSRHALKTEMVRQSNERARQLRAFFKIDFSPATMRASSCSASTEAAAKRRISCMRLSERKSAPPWSAEMMLTRSRYLLAVGLRPSMPGNSSLPLVTRL